jgi:hypothetical protein
MPRGAALLEGGLDQLGIVGLDGIERLDGVGGRAAELLDIGLALRLLVPFVADETRGRGARIRDLRLRRSELRGGLGEAGEEGGVVETAIGLAVVADDIEEDLVVAEGRVAAAETLVDRRRLLEEGLRDRRIQVLSGKVTTT